MLRIDSHQHFWQYNKEHFAWMDSSMGVLQRDYLPKELKKEQEKLDFTGSIAVQARQIEEETRWLLELANDNENILGVVGWLDIQSDNFETVLDSYLPNPHFVGLRHIVQDEPDDNFMLKDNFLRGLAIMVDKKLPYDILVFPKHLPVVKKILEKFPKHDFVIDHLAKPNIKKNLIKEWQEDMKEVAQFSQLRVKLSGMVTEADWFHWKTEDFTPYLDAMYHLFGEDRLMIGSDWPVCKLASEYEPTMNIVLQWIEKFPISTQEKILGSNAATFYQLSLS